MIRAQATSTIGTGPQVGQATNPAITVNQVFHLSNRRFNIESAVIDLTARLPTLDIETSFEEFDGERWAP